MQGDYFVLPVEHVIFGAGSLERCRWSWNAESSPRPHNYRAEPCDQNGIVRKVEETLGARTPGLFSASASNTPESDVARAVEEGRACRPIFNQPGRGQPDRCDQSGLARALAQSGGQYLPPPGNPYHPFGSRISHLAGVTNESGGQPIKAGFETWQLRASRPARSGPHPRNAASALALHKVSGRWTTLLKKKTFYAPGALTRSTTCWPLKPSKSSSPLFRPAVRPGQLDTRLELHWRLVSASSMNSIHEMGLSHNIGRRLEPTYTHSAWHHVLYCPGPVMRLLAPVPHPGLARIAGILNLPEARA